MVETDTSNLLFQLAVQFVNQTARHLFLTGKAGTGKTTFLKYIAANGFKKMAIVAPTGVAAINAGGVTIHSFFQLPFGPFVPFRSGGWNHEDISITDQHTLFKNIRFNAEKRELLQELDMIVIDEVSMLRSDMLDAIDFILRHFRHRPMLPFGGIQMIYIGDLFQLPPVVKQEEWQILQPFYKSPFFFDAQVIQQATPLYLELKKIYRQTDDGFINILDHIRNNKPEINDLEQLHRHYKPRFRPPKEENYITLTTHNSKAEFINRKELDELPGKLFEFKGEIEGDFIEKALPADMKLHLKEGAQIMFLKNDKGENRKYYNGKIAQVSRITEKNIYIKFTEPGEELELEKETWKNIRYRFHKEKDRIEEEELGTFTQYPIRLAWAITIHKSQGLTFSKAIIDAGGSFAAGQVYVALSRLTSLEGLVLFSRIHSDCISTDERVLAFTRNEKEESELKLLLQEEQPAFLGSLLVRSFDWTKLTATFEQHVEQYEERMIPAKESAENWARGILNQIHLQQEVSVKFIRRLEQYLLLPKQEGYTQLYYRTKAAAAYFGGTLSELILSFHQHIKEFKVKQRVKKYIEGLRELTLLLERKKQELLHAVQMAEALMKGVSMDEFLPILMEKNKDPSLEMKERISDINNSKISNIRKGATRFISLELFKEGMSVSDIAKTRGLTTGTIEGHLAEFIITGEVEIQQLLTANKIESILQAIESASERSSYAIKEKLGEGFSYGDIKAVMHYRSLLQMKGE